MPDDYIIRQGELGDSMYFMTSGAAKIIVKSGEDVIIQVFHIGKGSFFGEVGLIMQQKRTADVKASDFCICESFNRESFLKLKVLFPGVEKRLQGGFSHYKVKNIESIIRLLLGTHFFAGFSKAELSHIVKDYLDLRLINSGQLILKPKSASTALYFVFSGSVQVLEDNEKSWYFLQKAVVERKGVEFGVPKLRGVPEHQYFDYQVDCDSRTEEQELRLLGKGDFFGGKMFLGLLRQFCLSQSCRNMLINST